MSNSRIKNGAYVIERPEEYFDDHALATFLLGEMRDDFQRAIESQANLDNAIKSDNFRFFSESFSGVSVAALEESGKEDEARALFQQLRENWEYRKPNEMNPKGQPSYQELMSELAAYRDEERKQLWDLMSDAVRKRVGFEPSSEEDEYNSESEESAEYRLR